MRKSYPTKGEESRSTVFRHDPLLEDDEPTSVYYRMGDSSYPLQGIKMNVLGGERKTHELTEATTSYEKSLSYNGRNVPHLPKARRTPAMLVLSRKKDESLVINENIRVTVLGIERGKVRLGIVAPKEIPVHRSEVHDRIRELNEPHFPAEYGEPVG
jgi:carbon storage regulator